MLQVRYTQLVRQKKRKPVGRSAGGVWRGAGSMSEGRLGARGGSRRSGYAFAHQEGFGELITSGKNMRLSSLALATFASRHSSSWIDTLRRKKHTHSHTPPSASGESSPAPSCVSGSVPPLSNSSSVLGGSQDTPVEEETGSTPQHQNKQAAPTSSTQSQPAVGSDVETATPQGPSQTLSSSAVRCHEGDSPGGWTFTLGTVQVNSCYFLFTYYLTKDFKHLHVLTLTLSNRKLCLVGRALQLAPVRPAAQAHPLFPRKPETERNIHNKWRGY